MKTMNNQYQDLVSASVYKQSKAIQLTQTAFLHPGEKKAEDEGWKRIVGCISKQPSSAASLTFESWAIEAVAFVGPVDKPQEVSVSLLS